MKLWYALHTKPNSEYQVATALRQQELETYLPEIEAPKSRRQRKTRPFFPCYLFVMIDFEQTGLSQVRWTPGLRRIVTIDNQPVPVPEAVIDLIRRQLGEIEAAGGWPAVRFRPGQSDNLLSFCGQGSRQTAPDKTGRAPQHNVHFRHITCFILAHPLAPP